MHCQHLAKARDLGELAARLAVPNGRISQAGHIVPSHNRTVLWRAQPRRAGQAAS